MALIQWLINIVKKAFKASQKAQIKPIEVPSTQETSPPVKIEIDTKDPNFEQLWETCQIDYSVLPEVMRNVNIIIKNKDRYESVSKSTNVPWYMIAVLHYRESSFSFKRVLHNGDFLPGPTIRVPRGRGPFLSWESAAIDAIKYDKLDKRDLSTIPMILRACERFNGLGYRKKGILSQYVWAGTNHSDELGKYVADGKFDAQAREKQLGVAALIKGLQIAKVI